MPSRSTQPSRATRPSSNSLAIGAQGTRQQALGLHPRWRSRQLHLKAMSASRLDATQTTQLIKKSIALRAKYRVDQGPTVSFKAFSPALIVPHQKNLGGDPVKTLRTRQLSGTIASNGCDPIEGCSNAVAVEEQPGQSFTGNPRLRGFQESFEQQVAADPDMALKVNGIVATVGSLSHGHLNCMMRNMLCGKRGCECGDDVRECKCLNSPILNEHGICCMDQVAAHDVTWAEICVKGISWEILSSRLDFEEPD